MSEQPSDGTLPPLEERIEKLERALEAIKANNNTAAAPQVAPPVAVPIMASVAETATRSFSPRLAGATWLLMDIYREAAAIFRMFVDFNYKVAWSTRLLTFILLPAILTSQWWNPFAYVPIFGTVFDKIIDVILAFVMFKALSREAQRYMETRTFL